eukprot:SAG11_NODE_1109_length_5830_cov_4.525388_2_plen_174_part_00
MSSRQITGTSIDLSLEYQVAVNPQELKPGLQSPAPVSITPHKDASWVIMYAVCAPAVALHLHTSSPPTNILSCSFLASVSDHNLWTTTAQSCYCKNGYNEPACNQTHWASARNTFMRFNSSATSNKNQHNGIFLSNLRAWLLQTDPCARFSVLSLFRFDQQILRSPKAERRRQ